MLPLALSQVKVGTKHADVHPSWAKVHDPSVGCTEQLPEARYALATVTITGKQRDGRTPATAKGKKEM
jgi:hypothetical protein